MKLTAKFVEHVSDAGKYYDLHGLFLHVRPSGEKNGFRDTRSKGAEERLV